jgi:segregation and condensation protein A
MSYHVHLTQFEGPLDLLLHLIRRDKINIYDIPISHITKEYLSYIEVMQELSLEVAGEFFVMAATLMRIKAQMLLPRRTEEDEEDEDPREELVRNLLEYRKFKEAAGHFAEKERDRRKVFTRPATKPNDTDVQAPLMEVSIFDLVDAFKKVMDDLKKQISYRIEKESHTVEEQMDLIRGAVNRSSEVLFTELFSGDTGRMEIIVTFLAILEMVRLGELHARQMTTGGDVWLYGSEGKPRDGAKERSDGIRERS